MQPHLEMLVMSSVPTIREGLCTLALALLRVKKVYTANCDLRSLPQLDEMTPALILLDCTFPIPELQALLLQVRTQWPQIKFVVLVDSEEERLQLDPADVDVILLRGIPAVRLTAVLKALLAD